MIFSSLPEEWSDIRRVIIRFEQAYALLPKIVPDTQNQAFTVSDPILDSSLVQALEAINELETLLKAYSLQSGSLATSLRYSLARRIEGSDLQLNLYTRLSLWERLWIRLSQLNRHELSETQRWEECSNFGISIARISAELQSDPRWSPITVHTQRFDFQAEELLAYLINHHPLFKNFTVELAPLDADLLHGLDLSIRCHQPKARGWFQLTLSAEEELNRSKLRQLKRSAAIGLLSPWTLALQTQDPSTLREFDQLFLGLSERERVHHLSRARNIAQQLKTLVLEVKDSLANSSPQFSLTPQSEMLVRLILRYLQSSMGRRAVRSYRISHKLPAINLTIMSALELRRELINVNKN